MYVRIAFSTVAVFLDTCMLYFHKYLPTRSNCIFIIESLSRISEFITSNAKLYLKSKQTV